MGVGPARPARIRSRDTDDNWETSVSLWHRCRSTARTAKQVSCPRRRQPWSSPLAQPTTSPASLASRATGSRPCFAAVAGAAGACWQSDPRRLASAPGLSLAWRSSHRPRRSRRCWMGRGPLVSPSGARPLHRRGRARVGAARSRCRGAAALLPEAKHQPRACDPVLAHLRADDQGQAAPRTHCAAGGAWGATVRGCHAAPMQSREQASAGLDTGRVVRHDLDHGDELDGTIAIGSRCFDVAAIARRPPGREPGIREGCHVDVPAERKRRRPGQGDWHGEQGHGASARLVQLGAFQRRGIEAVAAAMIPEGAVR